MSQQLDNDEIEATLHLLGQVTRQLHMAISELASETGKSLSQVKTMLILLRHGPCPVSRVAENLDVSPPTASEHIDHLVESGLAIRRINPEDRRQVLVELTSEAEALARSWFDIRCAQVRVVLKDLSPEDRQVFRTSLAALVDVLHHDPDGLLAIARGD